MPERVLTAAERAHQRLSAQLPKRTHEWRAPDEEMVRAAALVNTRPSRMRRPPSEESAYRRMQIRAWLAQQPRPSVEEMAQRLGITVPGVRYHVAVIENEIR